MSTKKRECECFLRNDDEKLSKTVAGRGGSIKTAGKAGKYKVDDEDSAVSSTDDRLG